MTDSNEPVRILAHSAAASRISRRALLGGAAVGALGASGLLAGCGTSSGTAGAGASSTPGAVEDTLHMYTWGAYNSPKVIKSYETEFGAKFTMDSYNSNEQLINKLVAAKGASGYDVVVPTGPFVPAMIQQDLLEPLDLSRIPNFSNLDPAYSDQSWDPGNSHTVCKDWGTTGYVYDKTKIDRQMTTWQDYLDVATDHGPGSAGRLRGVPGQHPRPAHQGVRLLPRRPGDPAEQLRTGLRM